MKSTCEANECGCRSMGPSSHLLTVFIFVVYKQNVNASLSTHVCPSCENCANDKLNLFTRIEKWIAWQKYTLLWYILVCLYWPIFVNIKISSVHEYLCMHIEITIRMKTNLYKTLFIKNGRNITSWINKRRIVIHYKQGC